MPVRESCRVLQGALLQPQGIPLGETAKPSKHMASHVLSGICLLRSCTPCATYCPSHRSREQACSPVASCLSSRRGPHSWASCQRSGFSSTPQSTSGTRSLAVRWGLESKLSHLSLPAKVTSSEQWESFFGGLWLVASAAHWVPWHRGCETKGPNAYLVPLHL